MVYFSMITNVPETARKIVELVDRIIIARIDIMTRYDGPFEADRLNRLKSKLREEITEVLNSF